MGEGITSKFLIPKQMVQRCSRCKPETRVTTVILPWLFARGELVIEKSIDDYRRMTISSLRNYLVWEMVKYCTCVYGKFVLTNLYVFDFVQICIFVVGIELRILY